MARIVKPLTNTEIDRAKPKEKDYSLSDGNGMYLLVKRNGTKTWRFQYYKPFVKKRALIGLGQYPTVSLVQARKIRDEYRSLLAENIDPLEHNRKKEIDALQEQENTFEMVAENWFKLRKNEVDTHTLKEITYSDIVKRVKRHLYPDFAHVPIKDITAPFAISKLKKLENQNKIDTLHRVTSYLNNIMVYAVNLGIIHHNPIADISKVFIKKSPQNNPTIRPEKLPQFFDTLQSAKISIETRCVLEFLLLTAMRAGTVTGAKWEEIDWDNQLWEIPKERMKGRIGKVQDFTVPLSKQSLKLLKMMKNINGNSAFIFPSIKSVHKPMNVETPNTALKRMGYQNILTAHGLRSIFSTTMNEKEFNAEIIEVCLAHFEYSSVRGTYNKAKYLEQRKEYMQWWADFVEDLSNGKALFS